MTISRLFAITLLLIFFTSPLTVFAAPKPLTIGVSFKKYKPPRKSECNVKIPKQYKTIQSGINAASPGNTVCVEAGTYNENIVINKSITLAGRGAKYKSIINGQITSYTGTVRIESNNVIIEGFVINGAGTDYGNGALRLAESVTGATIRYNHIKAGKGEIALLTDGFQNSDVIQDNILEGNNSPQIALVNGAPTVSKASDKVDFLNNSFVGSVLETARQDTGIVLATGATNSKANYNVFNVSGSVIKLINNSYASADTTINFNNFDSSATYKVSNSVGTLNAKNNWWGDTNPSNKIQGDVDYTPFATSPFSEF